MWEIGLGFALIGVAAGAIPIPIAGVTRSLL